MDQEKIGKFVKEIRKKNNLTQKELADKYNVTYQAVSKWETGKNMPDTALIKQMSKDFNISIDDIFDGEYSKKNTNRKNIYIISITLIIITIIIILYLYKHNNSFEFKTLKSSCDNFNISGIISYNDLKSSIYISDITYCGPDDQTIYDNITCTLYEKNNDSSKIIDTCDYDKNSKTTLEDFLKDVSFTVDNYQKICKKYKQDSLYLEIQGTDENEKTISYKIPLKLENDCE